MEQRDERQPQRRRGVICPGCLQECVPWFTAHDGKLYCCEDCYTPTDDNSERRYLEACREIVEDMAARDTESLWGDDARDLMRTHGRLK